MCFCPQILKVDQQIGQSRNDRKRDWQRATFLAEMFNFRRAIQRGFSLGISVRSKSGGTRAQAPVSRLPTACRAQGKETQVDEKVVEPILLDGLGCRLRSLLKAKYFTNDRGLRRR